MEKTVTITITVDPHEEMFSIDGLEYESGDTWEYGPAPLWSDWKDAVKEKVGGEIIDWIEWMAEEDE